MISKCSFFVLPYAIALKLCFGFVAVVLYSDVALAKLCRFAFYSPIAILKRDPNVLIKASKNRLMIVETRSLEKREQITFGVVASIEDGGILTFGIDTKKTRSQKKEHSNELSSDQKSNQQSETKPGLRSSLPTEVRSAYKGTLFFDAMMEALGERVQQLEGYWIYGSNLEAFNQFTLQGYDKFASAFMTWTGHQAKRYGYTGHPLVAPFGVAGNYHRVTVLFRKPHEEEEPK